MKIEQILTKKILSFLITQQEIISTYSTWSMNKLFTIIDFKHVLVNMFLLNMTTERRLVEIILDYKCQLVFKKEITIYKFFKTL